MMVSTTDMSIQASSESTTGTARRSNARTSPPRCQSRGAAVFTRPVGFSTLGIGAIALQSTSSQASLCTSFHGGGIESAGGENRVKFSGSFANGHAELLSLETPLMRRAYLRLGLLLTI